MKTHILHIFTRTPLHVGAGSSVGAVDQPIQRERHTGFPIIPGSSIKGVLRDHFEDLPEFGAEPARLLFGHATDDKTGGSAAGLLSFSEARPLLFPLRSARGSYALATCPLSLRRFSRDAGLSTALPDEPADMHCLAGASVTLPRGKAGAVVLEEYCFEADGEFPAEWSAALRDLLDDAVLAGAENRFVLLSNGDFSHFAVNACQVSQHVRIDDETGTAESGGLFNEETVPSETLFYSLLTSSPRKAGHNEPINQALSALRSETVMQFGGNSTTGLGFCTVKLA